MTTTATMRTSSEYTIDGRYPMTDRYKSRYYARKAMGTDDMAIVKVYGGYKLMEWGDYHIWRKQK